MEEREGLGQASEAPQGHGPVSPFGPPEERARVFLAEYGERGRLVLEAAISAWRRITSLGLPRLGDFDYKTLVAEMRERGVRYRPNQLLRRLERDYDLIETSYKSSNQHWWVFRDREAVERALSGTTSPGTGAGGPVDDPRRVALLVKYSALEPQRLLEELRYYESRGGGLTERERERLRGLLLSRVDEVAELLARMREEGREAFGREVRVLEELLQLALMVSRRFFG